MNTTPTTIQTDEEFQNEVNSDFRHGCDLDELVEKIRARAEAKHAKFPQYDGHWNDWYLVEVCYGSDRHGDTFHATDITIGYGRKLILQAGTDWTAYSLRLNRNCSIPFGIRRVH